MDPNRICSLLSPFVAAPLPPAQVEAIATYVDLLLRWNARLNLTAIRDAENIVTRHFGESLFAARNLLDPQSPVALRAFDVGSGPGFPGLPLKIVCPRLRLTLVESQHKKATFLKEVIRALRLEDTDVYTGRAETYPAPATGDLVTLRAVEHFEQILPVAARLLRPTAAAQPTSVAPGSCPAGPVKGATGAPRLAVLIGASQAASARELEPNLRWNAPIPIPQSNSRILLVGSAVGLGPLKSDT